MWRYMWRDLNLWGFHRDSLQEAQQSPLLHIFLKKDVNEVNVLWCHSVYRFSYLCWLTAAGHWL